MSGVAAGLTGAAPSAWSDAVCAAALFAVDPAGPGLGGIVVRAPAGPVRDAFLALLATLLPPAAPVRRVPADVDAARLDGGLDLAATLAAGRPVEARGLLAAAAGGVLLLVMAERLSPATAARIATALDADSAGGRADARLGLVSPDHPGRFGVVALDEGIEPDERPPVALTDRLGLFLELDAVRAAEAAVPPGLAAAVAAARQRLAAVRIDDAAVTALCAASAAFGIGSLRAPLQALAAARASAALAGRAEVGRDDVALAARLVLAPRATVVPMEAEAPPPEAPEPPADDPDAEAPPTETPPADTDDGAADRPLEDVVLEAVRAALPPDLLAGLLTAAGPPRRSGADGRAGETAKGGRRGRPVGVRRADPRGGDRISAYETIKAAAPWQRVRRAEAARAAIGAQPSAGPVPGANPPPAQGAEPAGASATAPRLLVRRDDFRAIRYEKRTGTTTIFVVDASGSSALNRLGEAKGAAELLLADCYVRRDSVALIAFRGRAAELLLPPTGSLTRAKRSLAGLPGGGGTPLAAGLDAAVLLADQVRRRGDTPVLVLLTDGGANIGRDGAAGRAHAGEDATASARSVRAARLAALLVDTAPRSDARARSLAEAMRATYLALPHGEPTTLAAAVRAATPGR